MKARSVYEMLQEVGIPIAYRSWVGCDGGVPPSRPYMIYYLEGEHGLSADDINYVSQSAWCVELYVDQKDEALEVSIETILTSKEIPFSKQEVGSVADAAPLLITYRFQTI